MLGGVKEIVLGEQIQNDKEMLYLHLVCDVFIEVLPVLLGDIEVGPCYFINVIELLLEHFVKDAFAKDRKLELTASHRVELLNAIEQVVEEDLLIFLLTKW